MKKKQVLVLKQKHSDTYIDATNVEKAFLLAFNYLDEAECFCLTGEDKPEPGISQVLLNSKDPDRIVEREKLQKQDARELAEWEEQRTLYVKAKAGDAKAAKALLQIRQDYEYENWSLEDLETP